MALAALLSLGAGAAHAEWVATTLTFDDLGPTTVGAAMVDGHGGFDWGAQWHFMTLAGSPDNTFLATSPTGGTSISRSDGGDFYFDGADFWSRRGADANGDFYFVLYRDGAVLYNGATSGNAGRMRFDQTPSFMSVAANLRIDRIAIGFDNDDADHLAMDNFRFRIDTAATTAVTTVPEPDTVVMLLAGLGAIGFMGRRWQRQQAQSSRR